MFFNPPHKSITLELLMEATERNYTNLDNLGYCTLCGTEHYNVEPDARDYHCQNVKCGADAVYGVEEIILRFL